MKLKRFIAGVLIAMMVFTNVFADNLDVYDNLLSRVETLLNAYSDRAVLASQIYLVKNELDNGNLENKVQDWLDDHNAEEQNLNEYGFNSGSINDMVDAFKRELPSSADDLTSGNTVFTKAYNDNNGLSYGEYADELKDMADRLFASLPPEAKAKLEKFDKNGTESSKQVFVAILDAVMNDKAGSVKYNTKTELYFNAKYEFTTSTKTKIFNVLDQFKDDGVADTNVALTTDAFFDLSNAVLHMMTNSVSGPAAQYLHEIMGNAKLITVTNFTPGPVDPVDPPNPPNPPSPSGPPATPPGQVDKPLNPGNQKRLENIEDNLPQAGENASDAQREAAKSAVDELMAGLDEDFGSAKDADAQLIAVSETVGKTLEILSAEDAGKVAESFADLIEATVGNPNLTLDAQKALIEDAVINTFSKLDQTNANSVAAKQKLENIINKIVKNAARVELLGDSVPQAGEGAQASVQQFNIVGKDVSKAIADAVKTNKDLEAMLRRNGLNDVANQTNPIVNLMLSDVKDDEKLSLSLAADAVKNLGDSGVDVLVEAKGVEFRLPAALMKLSKALTIETKPLEAGTTLLPTTAAGQFKTHKVVDASVKDGETDIKGMVELSFSIADLEGVDLDTLMVGVYEDGVWTKIGYEIVGDKIVFLAPHFSIYSLGTYESAFEDVNASWAKKYILSLTARGIVSGRSDIAYDPDATLTRAEFTTLLVKHLGLEDEVTVNFKDVDADAWYYDYVGRAGLHSLAVGIEEGNFKPNEAITREDMAVMLYRAYKQKYGFNLNRAAAPFSDNSTISVEARDAVYAAKTHGIISGYPDNTFRPEGLATRAEAATIMYLFLQK